MYIQSYGLNRNPFNMTPDPAFLFMTAQHREALAGLAYSILQRKGFMVLTGEAGTGKTTLLAKVLQFMPANRLQFSLILNPTLTASEFLELAMLDFGVTDVPASKAQRIWRLQSLLFEGRKKGKISVLVIDEAHKLSPEVLEEVRLLGNFEEAEQKLIQILLVGQSELDESLNRQDLRQLKQRIAIRLSIGPLSPGEVGPYLSHRWTVAGGERIPFATPAVDAVADLSRGIPRVINSLCDNALTLTFSEGLTTVEARHVQMAADDLRIAARQPGLLKPVPLTPLTPVPDPKIDRSRDTVTDDIPVFEGYNGNATESFWSRWTGKLKTKS
jgi:general secretion pathway protein A